MPPTSSNPSDFDPFLPAGPDESVAIDLERWLVIARRRWRLALTLCVLALAGWLAAWWSEPWWDTEYYPTQHKLLASRGLAELVVDKLLAEGEEEVFPGIARPDASQSQEAADQARG